MILFETERLLLREFLPEDYDDLFSMNSDPEVMRYLGDGSVRTREQTRAELKRLLSYYHRKPGLGLWATVLKDSYQFIGASGLVYYDDTLEIGLTFLFAKEHWNQGYGTEASRALLKYGFEKLGLQKIVCRACVDNKAAVVVMERIGMRHVDTHSAGGRLQACYELDRNGYKAARHP